MNDDYLWDRSGKPDPEVEELEKLLEEYRYDPTVSWADRAEQANIRTFSRPRRIWLAIAASLVIALVGSWIVLHQVSPSWNVSSIAGMPQLDSAPLEGKERLRVGEWLETDARSRASISVGRIGSVEVDPGSRLQIVESRLTDHRLSLQRGRIHATISAPPRIFFVETPAGTAVDLGCKYSLDVDSLGAGMLRVTAGWVAYQQSDRESFVPAGAACYTRPGKAPGTPFYVDAAPAFRQALTRLDFEPLGAKDRQDSLAVVLGNARRRDVLTLWHLLQRVEKPARGQVFDVMAALSSPPAKVSREGIVVLDRRMVNRWGRELGVNKSNWWEVWKRL